MPVFDFSDAPDAKNPGECTYTTFQSSEPEASPEKPILVLDNKKRKWQHHSCGMFTNPVKRTTFEFQEKDGTVSADILKIDARFVSLLKWLGENHISVCQAKTVRKGMLFTKSGRRRLAAAPSFRQKTAFYSL